MSTKPQDLRNEAKMLSELADGADRRSVAWREHAASNVAKADALEQIERDGRGVRVFPNRVEIAVGPGEHDWQFRAVKVGRGFEITRNERFHGWVEPKVLRRWYKAIKRLGGDHQVRGRRWLLGLTLVVGLAGCSVSSYTNPPGGYLPAHPTYGQVANSCNALAANDPNQSRVTEGEYHRCMDSADKLLGGRP